ncbi:MAG TPA: DUF222 domain-containing protein [Actinomycetota bacterium]|jgi:5-methylcytosine-specific restriction endonuclease McrA|nr:DUF222 domain-containing protein [Actinomycetota bacterium]
MCSSDVRAHADRAHARFCSARAELVGAVAELRDSGAWQGDGAGNLAAWLAARWQIGNDTARALVREAEALAARPALLGALRDGVISTDQCKALTVLSSDETGDDELWLDALPFWSLPELQREARKQTARELERRNDGVYFRTCHTPNERYLRGEFQLHPEDGAALVKAIDDRVPNGTQLRDWDFASARALVEMAKSSLVETASSDRATVLLSVGEESVAAVDGGFVGLTTAKRIACDARVQALHRAAEGTITGIGRTSRTVPPWLRRAVMARDDGVCTFPGCGRDRYLECHHIVHYADGGSTDLGNLQLVCWTHHELLHEGGWSLRGDAGPTACWIRPDGTPFEPRVVLDTS